MEMMCYRISCKDHVANDEVRAKIQQAIGPHEDLMTIVKRRKLQWYSHVTRSSGLAKNHLARYSEWEVWQVPEGSGEQGKMEETGCEIICAAPKTIAIKG